MGRRHRHFKWSALSPDVALDARYLTGADNSAISSWTDVGGGGRNATDQGNSARRPTLRTGANGLASQNLVNFDGVDDGLIVSSVGYSGGNLSLYCMGRVTDLSNVKNIGVSLEYIKQSPYLDIAAIYVDGGTLSSAQFVLFAADPGTNYAFGSGFAGSYNVFTGITSTSSSDGWRGVNGSGTSMATGTVAAGADGMVIGYWPSAPQYHTWSIGIALALPYATAPPLRKRIEHAMAFAYKRPQS